MSPPILRLAIPSPLRRLFDYYPPPGTDTASLQPGVRVRVPFGPREVIGILVEITAHSDLDSQRIRAAREQSPARRGRRRAASHPAPATHPPTPARRGRKA